MTETVNLNAVTTAVESAVSNVHRARVEHVEASAAVVDAKKAAAAKATGHKQAVSELGGLIATLKTELVAVERSIVGRFPRLRNWIARLIGR